MANFKRWLKFVTQNWYLPLSIVDVLACVYSYYLGIRGPLLIGICVFFGIVILLIVYLGMYKAYKRYVDYLRKEWEVTNKL